MVIFAAGIHVLALGVIPPISGFLADRFGIKRALALELRPILREAGLQLLSRRSFLWTDVAYGAYTRELLETFADAACERGQLKAEERDEWKKTLNDLAQSGDFYYGIVYHLVAGRCVS